MRIGTYISQLLKTKQEGFARSPPNPKLLIEARRVRDVGQDSIEVGTWV